MPRSIIVYQEPMEPVYVLRYMPLVSTWAILVLACITIPAMILYVEESVLWKVTVAFLILMGVALIWYPMLTRQRLTIYSDALQPAHRPLKYGLMLRNFIVPLSKIASAKIVEYGYQEEWFNDIAVVLKSGEELHLNSPIVSAEAYVQLKNSLSEAGIRIESVPFVDERKGMTARKRATRAIMIGFGCLGIASASVLFISYVAEMSLVPALVLSIFAGLMWTIVSLFVHVHSR